MMVRALAGPIAGWLIAGWLIIASTAASAQQFPALSGRVVDAANIISPAVEAELTGQLAALETQSQRQFVIATVPDLGGNDIADYGYRLGRHWGIGDDERDDGVILLVAPNERRMHIAVGYGLEPVLTDALSATIIRNDITPRFRDGDFDGGIRAGAAAIIRQLQLPAEEAATVAAAAAQENEGDEGSAGFVLLIIFLIILFFVVIPALRSTRGGKRYRGRRGGWDAGPIIVWGPGSSGGWGGGSSGGSNWGGGGFGGGGFGGGGGGFGGGGASGGW
jgi:uncharacterized protein